MNYANAIDRKAVISGATPSRSYSALADGLMTAGNRECKVQVHVLARVCTYRRINGPCTCTKPALVLSPTVIERPSQPWTTAPESKER